MNATQVAQTVTKYKPKTNWKGMFYFVLVMFLFFAEVLTLALWRIQVDTMKNELAKINTVTENLKSCPKSSIVYNWNVRPYTFDRNEIVFLDERGCQKWSKRH